MNKRFFAAAIFSAFAYQAPLLAQAVPHDDGREFLESIQVENQWTDQRTDVYVCQVERLGKPFFHNKTPDGRPWDGTSDPGDAYVQAEDSCGARFENLSGVYESGGTQYIVTHDPRSGRIEIRSLYVDPNTEPRKTWAIGLGWTHAEGRIHADEMWLNSHSIFPPRFEAACPDEFTTVRRVPLLWLGRFEETDDAGMTQLRQTIHYSWPRLRISSSCEVTFMERSSRTLTKLDLEP